MASEIADDAVAADPTYAFKPSLMGATCQFTLRPDALEWQIGRRSGRTRYDRVAAIRLSYRPVTMQAHRFVTEIWSPDHPKIQIVSASWRSLVEQERLDKGYAEFLVALHRRVAAAGSGTQFLTGMPAVTYWIGAVLFGVVMVTTGVMVVRALQLGQWSVSAIIGAFFLVFAIQIGNYFRRNRPGSYRPDAIPAAVLPKI
jgi:hypothetical protein